MNRRLVPVLGVLAVLAAGCAPTTGPAGPATAASRAGSGTGVIGSVPPSEPGPEPSDAGEIPDAAILAAEDVGAAYSSEPDTVGDDHGSIAMLLSYCGVDLGESANHAVASRFRSLYHGTERYVHVRVTRYESGWAQRYLEDLAAALPGCSSIAIMGDPADIATMRIIDRDAFGDGSLLIQELRAGAAQHHAVVRRGDAVAYLRIHTGGDEANARAIAQAAADRLCAMVDAC